jgi:eukaryotic-like serine/threonine-protein kinase
VESVGWGERRESHHRRLVALQLSRGGIILSYGMPLPFPIDNHPSQDLMDTDRNLLFGVLALQADLIDAAQFIEVCLVWTSRKDEPLVDLLVERSWIKSADREHLAYLVEHKLRKHAGASSSLGTLPDAIRCSLAAIDDDDIHRSLDGCAHPVGSAPASTLDHVPARRERYSRLCLHATGGIGRVWLARDADLGRNVALKELRPERAEDAVVAARFLQEAQITGQLEHPGIVPVYDMVRAADGRQPFYTMRFVKGRTLSDAARTYHERRLAGTAGPLDFPTLLNAFVTVCNTVAFAHSRGIIHRDLKGQNVILGDFGEVVVLDWGLAKVVGELERGEFSIAAGLAGDDGSHTVEGQALGTPGYMAPEQAAGQLDLIDRRTDVYGLGAILYEVLTGAPPFSGDSTEDVLRRVANEPPAPPRQFWSDVPSALETLCLRALSKQSHDRPGAPGELADEVQGWQEFERRKAEEALRESEALYHSLVETLPLGVWRKDLAGRFTFGNRRFCESLGKSPQDIEGRTDFDFFPPNLAEKYQQDDARVRCSATLFEATEDHVTVAGEKLFVHVVKTPILDARGDVAGVQGIFWDLTAQKRLEESLRESEALYHSLVEHLPCIIVRKDLQGRFSFANHGFSELVGRSLDEILGKTDFDLFPAALAEKYRRDDQQVMKSGGTHEIVDETIGPAGERFFHVLKTVVRDGAGTPKGMQLIAWETTERKVAQEEVASLKEQLARLGEPKKQ